MTRSLSYHLSSKAIQSCRSLNDMMEARERQLVDELSIYVEKHKDEIVTIRWDRDRECGGLTLTAYTEKVRPVPKLNETLIVSIAKAFEDLGDAVRVFGDFSKDELAEVALKAVIKHLQVL